MAQAQRFNHFDREMQGWGLLAVSALAVAGLLALGVAGSRTPGIQDGLPENFFQSMLVTHVTFSVSVWYLAVFGALCAWVASRRVAGGWLVPGAYLGAIGLRLAWGGFLCLLAPAMMGWGEPSLNNYIPVMVHPVFYSGLGLLFLGVALPVFRLGFVGIDDRDGVGMVLAAAGGVYFCALLSVGLAWSAAPAQDPVPYNEMLFWGGGHLLQFVNTLLMLAAWQAVGTAVYGQPPIPPVLLRWLALSILVVGFAGPVLYLVFPITSGTLHVSFTRLYQIGLIVQPVIALLALLRFQIRAGWAEYGAGAVGLSLSAAMFTLGGAFGYLVGEGDTRTPAHYHLMIGAVTLAFMGLFFLVILPGLGRATSRGRAVLTAFALYAGGQTLHALALFVAGALGIARKTAGASQGLDTPLKTVVMGVMGGGALLAVIGGILFVGLAGWKLIVAPRKGSASAN
ncbi:cbb3-type cytochrome c oxidase subunit I [Novispirillum itersonii]|uniref:Cytochrome oxidase subunit I profile domain-containing protein n=1 Tax=Novispirillum itersonii TaxID=189 RepID=A0A7W9ZCZ5_NOVIT|nr:cbb3-type cytochrome c oxidase subunit I [Novispirillum itersonii]MBB6208970.1 hypothetical protein [Novispirillum itersonii]